MNRQEARGKEKKLVGEGKEIVGIMTFDSALEREGGREAAEGAAEEKVGKARRKAVKLVGGATEAIEK